MVSFTPIVDANGDRVVVVQGQDFDYTPTLTKDGGTYNLTNHVVTASVRPLGSKTDSFTDHSVTLTTPSSGIVTLTVLDTESAKFEVPNKRDVQKTITHVGEFKVVESGGLVYFTGPFSFEVRAQI